IPAYKLQAKNYSKDDKHDDIPYSSASTFHEQLVSQLGLQVMTDRQLAIAEYIIGNIDEDGYLRREIDEIVDDIAFSQNLEVDEKEALEVLRVIQDFDPAGVGARDLRECLILQMDRKKGETVASDNALEILKDYFEEFTRKHYEKIAKRMQLDDDDLKDAIDEILKLNPKPGGAVHDSHSRNVHHIVPDFILEEVDGELILSLNSKNVPDLKINRQYSNMLKSYAANKESATKQQKEAIVYVKQKIDSAKWFIDAIRQRQNTLLFTMRAIIEYQEEFFRSGDEMHLKPMILKDIAEETDLDISTISRVANSKYIQTNHGIFSLKFFFSEGMQTDSGEEVSTKEIKKILADCVNAEDKKKTLTDEKLMEILREKGYPIARRTVAKYREQLGIPVARLRKEL
ncbi:MAG TPA: RNA polymerase sigma-54 factor, partial [Bacteroidales bacterium]|nr:RNA polymerase sigma-54 factor [Bacteroidales bacterium]